MRRRATGVIAAIATLAVLASPLVGALPAQAAATTYTVTSGADGGSSDCTTAAPTGTLRRILCDAQSDAGPVTITMNNSVTLTVGELRWDPRARGGATAGGLTIQSNGSTITGDGTHRVLDLDPSQTGGVSVSLQALTIRGGRDTTTGGAGINGGSVWATTADSLTTRNVQFIDNISSGTSAETNNPGGAVQFLGGSVSMTQTTFQQNSATAGPGGGIAWAAYGGGTLSIDQGGFAQNSVSTTSAAAAVGGADIWADGPTSITRSDFRYASVTGSSASLRGGSILHVGGSLSVTESRFVVPSTAVPGWAIWTVGGATTTTSGNAFEAPTTQATPAVAVAAGSTTTATRSYWGCNTGPATSGCQTAGTGVTTGAYLKFALTASPSSVDVASRATSTVTVAVVDSTGAASTSFAMAQPVQFSSSTGSVVASGATSISAGQATATYRPIASGPGSVSVTIFGPTNNVEYSTSVSIAGTVAPSWRSPATSLKFTKNAAASYTYTATGYPTPALTVVGTLPTGLTFTDKGDGTATLGGTPTGATGTTTVTLHAAESGYADATVQVSIQVGVAPVFTSDTTATFTKGTSSSFSITTSADPTVSAVTESGSLPAGLTFTDNGNGTATIAGSATATGSFPVTLSAVNGYDPTATQQLTVRVIAAPVISGPTTWTVQTGQAGSVTYPVAAGYPSAFTTSVSGATLPSSLTTTPSATGITIAGTPAAGDTGTYAITIQVSNEAGSTSIATTLRVVAAPVVTTNPVSQTVSADTSATFTAAASGYPTPTVQWQRSTNGGGTWADVAGATSTSLTVSAPLSADGYRYRAVFSNEVQDVATSAAILSVKTGPHFTSADHATWTSEDGTHTFTVTADGDPAATLSTATVLPSWLTFTPATGILSGDPTTAQTGTVMITFDATNGYGTDAHQTFTLTVTRAPVITTAPASQTVSDGTQTSFTAAAVGYPTPTVQWSRSTDGGGTFTAIAGATSTTLTVDAALADDGDVYRVTFTSTAGSAHADATLGVKTGPTITSDATASWAAGASHSFTIETRSDPAATIAIDSALPSWLAFDAATATLSGTPSRNDTGVVTIGVTASNGYGTDAHQTLTITVTAAPIITMAPQDTTVSAGDDATFTAAAEGSPTPTVQWYRSTNGGASFTAIAGATSTTLVLSTTLADDGDIIRATFTNADGSTSADATLGVKTGPTITSADTATFAVGDGEQSFDLAVTSDPAATVTVDALPAWLSFDDATLSLSGTPPTGSGGTYDLVVHATNGYGTDAQQALTLTVTEAPTFMSTDAADLTVGIAGSATITTSHAYPTPVTITVDGTLPDGLTLTDHGDGTADIAGTPAAGTGGVHTVTLVASTGIAADDATQSFAITVAEAPTFTSASAATVTRGVDSTVTITTGHSYPAVSSITLAGTLPSGLSFTDHGDGTATIAGTTTDDTASFALTLTADNGDTVAEQRLTLTIEAAPVVDLPLVLPASDGELEAPSTVTAGEEYTVGGDGYAPFATVVVGIYSTPTALVTTTADATGAFTATVSVPIDLRGAHTFVSSGTDSAGDPRYLESAVTVRAPGDGTGGGGGTGGGTGSGGDGTGSGGTGSGGTGSGTGSSGSGATGGSLAYTGDDSLVLGAASLLFLVLGGVLILGRRIRRRTR